jgi:hypothetical protein
MIAMTDPTQTDPAKSNEAAGRWLIKLPAAVSVDRDAHLNLADLNDDLIRSAQTSGRKRVMLAVTRFAITFCIGIAATLAWLPYGDAAREMIASSSPQLGWLAPPSASAAQGASGPLSRDSAPADLDAVRDRIDRIATGQDQMTRVIGQLTATQEQIAQEIAKLREVEEYLLYKISYKEPEAAPRPAVPAAAAATAAVHKQCARHRRHRPHTDHSVC